MILLNVLAVWNFGNAVERSVMQAECKNGLVGICLYFGDVSFFHFGNEMS